MENLMSAEELYTITLSGQTENGEKIPPRGNFSLSPAQKITEIYMAKHGKPPLLTTAAMLHANPAHSKAPSVLNRPQKTPFSALAREYQDRTHEKTQHVPFMSYWPSYEYMSEAQMNWYFYLRCQLELGEYTETDLSYIFIYIYEILNQVNITDPNAGFAKLILIWKNYRATYFSLDRYLVDWAVDYIDYYNCDEKAAFDILQKGGLFSLLPADVLFTYYIKNDMPLPVDLIARFSDYRFINSEFVKGENGSMFLDNLSLLIHKVRVHMNQSAEGRFEKQNNLPVKALKRIPFQRALFDNPDNKRLDGYPSLEKHKPFRESLTSVIKEFENQLRILLKHKGRLKYPVTLSEDVLSICRAYAQRAVNGEQQDENIEIKIDRDKLFELIQDSDQVRKRLLEGSYDYGVETEADSVDSQNTDATDATAVTIEETEEASEQTETQAENKLLPGLSETQQKILDFLLHNGGSGTAGDINAAFPGVFIGVEIDRINDMALEVINDLLIGFEDELWYIMEDYINDL